VLGLLLFLPPIWISILRGWEATVSSRWRILTYTLHYSLQSAFFTLFTMCACLLFCGGECEAILKQMIQNFSDDNDPLLQINQLEKSWISISHFDWDRNKVEMFCPMIFKNDRKTRHRTNDCKHFIFISQMRRQNLCYWCWMNFTNAVAILLHILKPLHVN